MKKVLLGGTLAVLMMGGGSAMAADLGVRPVYKAPPPPPAVFSWSSCYLGLNGGGKWGKFSGTTTVAPVAGAGGTPGGVLGFGNTDFEGSAVGGGQVGCQWQASQFVFGVEGDIDATSIKQSFVAPVGTVAPFAEGDTITLKNRWQASLRGRLGLAFDHWLVYATGGVAWADIKANFTGVPVAGLAGFSTSDRDTVIGGTVGGGIEYAFTNNLSLGVEYRYTRFDHGDFTFANLPLTANTSAPFTGRADLRTHEVTARLNWHFNTFGGP